MRCADFVGSSRIFLRRLLLDRSCGAEGSSGRFRRRPQCRNHQNRAGRSLDNRARHTANQRVPKGGTPVRADDDVNRARHSGVIHDLMRRRARQMNELNAGIFAPKGALEFDQFLFRFMPGRGRAHSHIFDGRQNVSNGGGCRHDVRRDAERIAVSTEGFTPGRVTMPGKQALDI